MIYDSEEQHQKALNDFGFHKKYSHNRNFAKDTMISPINIRQQQISKELVRRRFKHISGKMCQIRPLRRQEHEEETFLNKYLKKKKYN